MITFKSVTSRNFLSCGNAPVTIQLNQHHTTAISAANGQGKCFSINTLIKLRNSTTGEVVEMTIGEFYDKINNSNGV